MSGAAAQGADSGAAAAGNQPTVMDDGFTDEERRIFDDMRSGGSPDSGGGAADDAGAGAGGDGAAAGADAGAGDAGAGAANGKVIEGDDEDDEDEGQQAGQAGQQPGADGQRPPPRRVNYKKYERMEQRAIAAEKSAGELKEMFARADERMKLINEALTGENKKRQEKNEQEDPEPDAEKDLFGWVQWSRRQMASMQQMLTEQRQQAQVSNDERTVADSYVEDCRRLVQSAKNPGADEATRVAGANFGAAYTYLMSQRMGELALYYYRKDIVNDDGKVDEAKLSVEEVRRLKAEIAAEERELVTNSIRANESPAMAVYRMARARGFRPAPPAQQGGGGQQAGADAAAGAGGGKAPGNLGNGAGGQNGGQQGQQRPNVADEIRRVQQGQQAGMSLSNGAGSPGQQALTPERLANMSQAEFNSMMENMGDAAFRRLMGG